MPGYYIQQDKIYNANDFFKLIETEAKKPGKENNSYELINGYIYLMASPNLSHQLLSRFIFRVFDSYFRDKPCEALFAPLDVFLFDEKRFALFDVDKDECKNVFVPDIMIVCDTNKLKKRGVFGAPDLVVEIVSDSTAKRDYVTKFYGYINFGVKEYWIVNPMKEKIIVYESIGDNLSVFDYTFKDVVQSRLFQDLCVDFRGFEPITEEK